MANLSKALKTDQMADLDLKTLAQILKARGRGKDTILAHITPEEAKLLKSRGGRGSKNPDTGLLEFEPGDFGGYDPETLGQTQETNPVAATQDTGGAYVPAPAPAAETPASAPAVETSAFAPSTTAPMTTADVSAFESRPYANIVDPYAQQSQQLQAYDLARSIEPSTKPAGVETGTPGQQEKSLLAGLSSADRLKLALGGGLGGLGVLQARKASQQAQAAKRDIAALGAPYQQQGQELIAAAQRGELTPANQQALQAASAQLQQGIAQRGGVGVAQAAQTLANLQNNMLQQQYTYGLQVAQIGDQYAQQAVQVGLQQDKELQALMQGLAMSFGSFAGSRPNTPAAQ
jgi:hypothetical protein